MTELRFAEVCPVCGDIFLGDPSMMKAHIKKYHPHQGVERADDTAGGLEMSGIIVAEYPKDNIQIKVRDCPESPEYVLIQERAIDGKWDPDEVRILPEDVPALIDALQQYVKRMAAED